VCVVADGKTEGGTPLTGVALVIAALVMGALWRDAPFVTARSAAEPVDARVAEPVAARLW